MTQLIVSPSPHIRSRNTTALIMKDVIIALIPAMIAGIIFFGIRALIITLVCVISCVVFEYLARRVMKKDKTISDFSAVVTGILLAFNLPVSIDLWIAVLGSFFAIVIVKQLFGGIGQNFVNPAIAARIILFVSFATQMTNWVKPFYYQSIKFNGFFGFVSSLFGSFTNFDRIDAIATATPLTTGIQSADTLNLFLGNVGGCIGEVSALALIIGGVYLVIRKVISPVVPLTFIGTVFVFTFILGENPLNHIFSGGLMLGAIFMATDYSTTPVTIKGKLIFAFGCGVITVLIRVFGTYPEGVSFAILFMNLLTPLIDKGTRKKPFGAKKVGESK
ncbi:MAG: RnfABCDGE type electron transport complex subunit D [Oscillospiraceae bacterium]